MVLIVRRDEVAECVRVEATFAGALDVLEDDQGLSTVRES